MVVHCRLELLNVAMVYRRAFPTAAARFVSEQCTIELRPMQQKKNHNNMRTNNTIQREKLTVIAYITDQYSCTCVSRVKDAAFVAICDRNGTFI